MARHGRTFPIKPHLNYPGRTGIYLSQMGLSGIVTLASVPVSGAIIRLIRQSTDTEVAKTTTNASGYYKFVDLSFIVVGASYHICVEYTDGGSVKYNAKSLWDVTPTLIN